jgi:hypothetical protein
MSYETKCNTISRRPRTVHDPTTDALLISYLPSGYLHDPTMDALLISYLPSGYFNDPTTDALLISHLPSGYWIRALK